MVRRGRQVQHDVQTLGSARPTCDFIEFVQQVCHELASLLATTLPCQLVAYFGSLLGRSLRAAAYQKIHLRLSSLSPTCPWPLLSSWHIHHQGPAQSILSVRSLDRVQAPNNQTPVSCILSSVLSRMVSRWSPRARIVGVPGFCSVCSHRCPLSWVSYGACTADASLLIPTTVANPAANPIWGSPCNYLKPVSVIPVLSA